MDDDTTTQDLPEEEKLTDDPNPLLDPDVDDLEDDEKEKKTPEKDDEAEKW